MNAPNLVTKANSPRS